MLRFLVERLGLMFLTMFITVSLGFFINRLAPGSAFDSERPLPPIVRYNLEKRYGLDKPLAIQYLNYMNNASIIGIGTSKTGKKYFGFKKIDLGESFVYEGKTVTEIIADSFPVSITLGTISLVIAVFFGSIFGITAAIYRNTWVDYLFSSVAIFGISLPVFVVGPILMLIFATTLHVLPTSGWLDVGPEAAILPVLSLSIPYFAVIARISRSSMLDVLRSDYIRTAVAKGLSFRYIIVRHGLKGAMLPVVSFLGPAIASIITGSLVIEQIFRIPGLGRPFVQSVLNRDYLLTMGSVIVYGFILVIMNTIVDLLYRFLDPRIKT